MRIIFQKSLRRISLSPYNLDIISWFRRKQQKYLSGISAVFVLYGAISFPRKGLICPEFPEKDQGINTGNAHNGKNNPGHSSECAEEVADQVKFKKTDESPVNSSNDDQYQSCNVKPVSFHVNSSFREAAWYHYYWIKIEDYVYFMIILWKRVPI